MAGGQDDTGKEHYQFYSVLQQTRGIVLRSVKYGETSLITTIFTETSGVEGFLVQGVRTAKHNRAAMLQPATLLDMTVYRNPRKSLQRLREFHPAVTVTALREDVVRNCIALFSAELLLRLLPEHAPAPELFRFSFFYLQQLATSGQTAVANYPLFFVLSCSRLSGYEIRGTYSTTTPYLHLQEGGFAGHPPSEPPYVTDADARLISLLTQQEASTLLQMPMNRVTRNRLLDWYLAFLHRHSQHLGQLKSLVVLREIL